jgi:hypothetical protein
MCGTSIEGRQREGQCEHGEVSHVQKIINEDQKDREEKLRKYHGNLQKQT